MVRRITRRNGGRFAIALTIKTTHLTFRCGNENAVEAYTLDPDIFFLGARLSRYTCGSPSRRTCPPSLPRCIDGTRTNTIASRSTDYRLRLARRIIHIKDCLCHCALSPDPSSSLVELNGTSLSYLHTCIVRCDIDGGSLTFALISTRRMC